jgi:hypothetical protein
MIVLQSILNGPLPHVDTVFKKSQQDHPMPFYLFAVSTLAARSPASFASFDSSIVTLTKLRALHCIYMPNSRMIR